MRQRAGQLGGASRSTGGGAKSFPWRESLHVSSAPGGSSAHLAPSPPPCASARLLDEGASVADQALCLPPAAALRQAAVHRASRRHDAPPDANALRVLCTVYCVPQMLHPHAAAVRLQREPSALSNGPESAAAGANGTAPDYTQRHGRLSLDETPKARWPAASRESRRAALRGRCGSAPPHRVSRGRPTNGDQPARLLSARLAATGDESTTLPITPSGRRSTASRLNQGTRCCAANRTAAGCRAR